MTIENPGFDRGADVVETERACAAEAASRPAAIRDEDDPDDPTESAAYSADAGAADDTVDPQRDASDEDAREVEAKVESLIPEEFAHLLDDPPLLWYESEEAYEELLGAIIAELQPKGVIEGLLVKDFVDYVWELRRLKRLKVAAIHYKLAEVVEDAFSNPARGLLEMFHIKEHYGELARAAGGGNPRAKVELAKLASKQHLKPVDLHLRAHRGSLPILEAISRETERLERRKDAILKQLDDRRAAMAAMARSLLARDEAETITAVVEAGKP